MHTGFADAEARLGQKALESFSALSLDAVPGRSGHRHPQMRVSPLLIRSCAPRATR
ncbi:hypothetical protein ACFY1L_38075 [Streptomyces sp. NPDC001663]|uniref:hypothetical protein n=1 Tax=Streptomyces sp. NPDC001663 TaxID=3364597 RepID=UPI0036743DA7